MSNPLQGACPGQGPDGSLSGPDLPTPTRGHTLPPLFSPPRVLPVPQGTAPRSPVLVLHCCVQTHTLGRSPPQPFPTSPHRTAVSPLSRRGSGGPLGAFPGFSPEALGSALLPSSSRLPADLSSLQSSEGGPCSQWELRQRNRGAPRLRRPHTSRLLLLPQKTRGFDGATRTSSLVQEGKTVLFHPRSKDVRLRRVGGHWGHS